MNYNPYAAPVAAPGGPNFGPQGATTGEPQAWTASEVTSSAWERFKPSGLMLSLMVFLMVVIQQMISAIPQQIFKAAIDDATTLAFANAGVSLLILPLSVFLDAGMRKAYLSVARGQPANIGDMFTAGSAVPGLLLFQFLPTLLAIPLVGGAAGAVALQMRSNSDSEMIPFIFGGMALFIIPLFIAYYLILWPVPFLLVDRKMPIGQAFREGARISKNSRVNIFVLAIIAFFLGILGACACLIGIFPATAVVGVASAVAYLRMVGEDPYIMGFVPGFPPGGGFGPPGGGFGAPGYTPPGGGGFGGPPPGGGFGGPPPGAGGFGPPGGGYGGPPPGGGFGGPPPGGGGFGGPPGGYGGPPPGGGY